MARILVEPAPALIPFIEFKLRTRRIVFIKDEASKKLIGQFKYIIIKLVDVRGNISEYKTPVLIFSDDEDEREK